jgi:serine/threonine-protein kinase
MLDTSRLSSQPAPLADPSATAVSQAASVPMASAATDQDADQTRIQTEPPPDLSDPGLPKIAGYELYSVLGKGGMGVVYKARQVGLQRLVALKMVRNADQADLDDLKRFRTEGEAQARLQHPNIVQIYEVGSNHGLPYCALEYCGGGSLHAKLAGDPLPPKEAARLAEILARAVAHAHAHGIVHRDLKPHNVLLSEEGEPKVTDFGLAKKLDAEGHQTQTGAVMGTPSYMAPEQAQGKAVGPTADVYALGAILYDLLTGRPPFKAATTVDTMLQVVAAEPVAPSSLNARVPRDLETICLKCLHKEPARRYASALELAEDLRRYQAGEPILARPVGQLERTWKWVRRYPAAAALWAAVVLLVLGISAAAVWFVQDRADRAAQEASNDYERKAFLGRQMAELTVRTQYVNKNVEAALDDAWRPLDEIDVHLADPVKTSLLMSDPEREWQARLARAQQARDQATALAGSASEVVSPTVKTRLEALDRKLRLAREDWALAQALDGIRLKAAEAHDGIYQPAKVAPLYQKFFACKLGLDFATGNGKDLAAKVAAHRLRFVLVAALDHWAELTPGQEAVLPTILEAARAADPDPWRDQVRDRTTWQDKARLTKLAWQMDGARHSPQVVLLLASRLDTATRARFLDRALIGRPRDFWMNLQLAFAVSDLKEKAGYFQAALAIRPTSAVVYNGLGLALRAKGDLDGAIAAYRQAIVCDSKYAYTHYNLALVLMDKGDNDGAVAACHQAIACLPKYVAAHAVLGNALRARGDNDGAIAAYHEALRHEPKYAYAYNGLGLALVAKGDLDGAIVAYQKAIELDAKSVYPHNNLGRALRAKGDFDGAVAAHKAALRVEPKFAFVHYDLGLALRARGDLEGAIAAFRQALDCDPKYTLARTNLDTTQRWLEFRERLPDVLTGQARPANPGEAVEFARFCLQRFQNHFAMSLTLYKEAFAADAKLLDVYPHRYNAACAALLLAAGLDATTTPSAEHAADLRTEAYQWLLAELELVRKDVHSDQPATRKKALDRLAHWKRDIDLASVRGATALAWLPEAERALWATFWADAEWLLNPGPPRAD